VTEFCPRYHHAVELIGKRWTGAIMRAMLAGRIRYAEIRDAVPALSDTMLSQRLDELELEGVIERRVVPESPVRVEYHLTEKGRGLQGAVAAIAAWAEEWEAVRYPCANGMRIFAYLSPEHAGKSPATLAGWFVDDLDETMRPARDQDRSARCLRCRPLQGRLGQGPRRQHDGAHRGLGLGGSQSPGSAGGDAQSVWRSLAMAGTGR
jgi:DNA-binding HxlR family transcriptional regulator